MSGLACPRCSDLNPPQWVFCGSCGCALDLRASGVGRDVMSKQTTGADRETLTGSLRGRLQEVQA